MPEENILPETRSQDDDKATGAEQAGRSGEQSVDQPSNIDADQTWSPGNAVASNKPVETEDESEDHAKPQSQGTSNTEAGM